MLRLPDIQTNELDLAAIYMVVTGRKPSMYREHGDKLVTFELPNDDITRNVMVSYATGKLVLNAKQFAAARTWLYRQTREVKP